MADVVASLFTDTRGRYQLAETHVNGIIEILQWIARTIPAQVVRDLERERDVELKTGAANQVINDPKLRILYGSQPDDSAAQNVIQ